MISSFTSGNLLDLNQTICKDLFLKTVYPWEVLSNIKQFILDLGPTLPKDKFYELEENVWIEKSAKVFKSAYIGAPCIIGAGSEIRHCAFIRSSAVIGENCVVGNSTELKNTILFNNVQVPHYNYVGDSVLGYKSHLGAGAITSNVKSDRSTITVRYENEKIKTDLKKFGAIISDGVEVGCNAVLNPGTIIGRNSVVYPLSSVRGFVPGDSIYKSANNIVEKKIVL